MLVIPHKLPSQSTEPNDTAKSAGSVERGKFSTRSCVDLPSSVLVTPMLDAEAGRAHAILGRP